MAHAWLTGRGVSGQQGPPGRGGLPEEAERAGHGQAGDQERNPFQFLTQRPFGDGAPTLHPCYRGLLTY